jgi:hypothetical protein
MKAFTACRTPDLSMVMGLQASKSMAHKQIEVDMAGLWIGGAVRGPGESPPLPFGVDLQVEGSAP